MQRPSVHTIHIHAFWESPESPHCNFHCAVCGNLLKAKRPPMAEAAHCCHFFQACVYCGVPTSLTVQGYQPNPTGEAPAPAVPQALERAAAAQDADRPPAPPEQPPGPPEAPEAEGPMLTLKGWRKQGALQGTHLLNFRTHGAVGIYQRCFSDWPQQSDDGDFIYSLDELEEMEALLKTIFDH